MTDLDQPDPDDSDLLNSSAPLATDPRSIPMRVSTLKYMKQSPKHTLHALLRGGGEQTLARRLGSGTHALLLGGTVKVSSGLASEHVTAGVKAINAGIEPRIYKGAVRRGKEWDKFLKENDGHIILTEREHEQAQRIAEDERNGVCLVSAEQYERANMMADSIRACEPAARILLAPDAIREERIDWVWGNRKWRSTPDARGFRVLAELKTTRCADPEVFHWDALRMGYAIQMAVYQRAIKELTGIKPRDVFLFAVESVAPYVVTPFELTPRALEHGDRTACEWHERYLECEARGDWPGYVTGLAPLDCFNPEDEATMEVERAMANDDGVRREVSF
jgi:hypothetical protein